MATERIPPKEFTGEEKLIVLEYFREQLKASELGRAYGGVVPMSEIYNHPLLYTEILFRLADEFSWDLESFTETTGVKPGSYLMREPGQRAIR